MDAFGQRKLGCRTSPERTRVPRVKRADPGRVFADGVAERQQRPAALVCAAGQGGGFAGPLFDGFDNLYVGQPGAIISFPPTQWTRWRQPVIGMPSTPRFLGHGRLLVSTHLGQLLVFDTRRGMVVGSPVDLVDGIDPTDATRGLADCAPARPGCPVAAAPAFSSVNGTVVVSVWQPGEPAAKLVGLKYHAEQLVREWTSDAVSAGVLASPVLSADGSTVYVNGRDHRLWALNAADGKAKWSAPWAFWRRRRPH